MHAMLVSPPGPDKVRKSFRHHPPRFGGRLTQNAQFTGTMYTCQADVSNCKWIVASNTVARQHKEIGVGITTADKAARRVPGARATASACQFACDGHAGWAARDADSGTCLRAGLAGSRLPDLSRLALPRRALSKPALPGPAMALLSLALLAGCAATGPNTVAPIPATAEAVSPLCPAWVTPCVGAPAGPIVGDIGDLPRLVQTADDLLFAGDEKGAWEQLNEALKIDPKHRPALLLMSQISDDPRKLLGDMSEPYTVGKAESLRQIAAARLGDARLFYALARYNNIAVPRQLEAGRSILLPLAATGAGPARAAPGRRGAASGADAAASSGSSTGAPTPATRAAAHVTPAPPAGTSAPGTAATLGDTAPRAATGAGATAGSGARAPGPTPPVTDAPAAGSGTATRAPGTSAPAPSGGDAELAFRRAAAAEKAGRTEQAYAGFMRALALGHPGAADRASALRQDLIAQQKRVARTALERQNFDIAIKALRNVLELDPGDSAAGEELRKAQRRRDASTGQRRTGPG